MISLDTNNHVADNRAGMHLQYPHVAAVYWSLYRLARFAAPSMVKRAGWEWYLQHAVSSVAFCEELCLLCWSVNAHHPLSTLVSILQVNTTAAMWKHAHGYGRWGLMVRYLVCFFYSVWLLHICLILTELLTLFFHH